MRVTQQIDALEIMGVNSASYVILPKIAGMLTMIPLLVVFSTTSGIVGAYATAFIGHIITPAHLTEAYNMTSTNGIFGWVSSRASSLPSSLPRFLLSMVIALKAVPSKWVKPLPMRGKFLHARSLFRPSFSHQLLS